MQELTSTTSNVSSSDYTDSSYTVQSSLGTDVKKEMLVTAYSSSISIKLLNNQTRKEKDLQNLNALLRKAGL